MKPIIPFITLAILSSSVLAEQVTPGNMPAYCRGMAASDFGTKPTYIKTGKLKKIKMEATPSAEPMMAKTHSLVLSRKSVNTRA